MAYKKLRVICVAVLALSLSGCHKKDPDAFSFAALKGHITSFKAKGRSYFRVALEHVSEDVNFIDDSSAQPEAGIMPMKKFVRKWIDEGRNFVAMINYNVDGHGYDSVSAKISAPKYNHRKGALSFTIDELPLSEASKVGRKSHHSKIQEIEKHVFVTLFG